MRKLKYPIMLGASFLLPIILLLTVFSVLHFVPFGDKSLLIMDMDNQYVQFFAGLKNAVFGDAGLWYSWDMGFGSNYLGLFSYYLSSPFSAVTLFFNDLPLGITVMTLIKIGLCGLTFSVFLRVKFGKIKWTSLVFSLCYALAGYNIGYSMCVMWLDSVIWLPIIILALERLVDSGKSALFIGVLFLTFISNYYTSFMVGGFCFLYFIYYCYITHYKRMLKAFTRFVLSAGAAAGLSAFLILPTAFCMFNGKIGGANYTSNQLVKLNPLLLISKLMAGNSYDTITYTGTPFVYAGIIIVLLLGVFFAAKNISKREKIGSLMLISVLVLSFVATKLDTVWHVFQAPNWFPFRYAFVFAFFIILNAYKAFIVFDRNSVRKVSVISVALCTVFALSGAEYKFINFILIAVYTIICAMYTLNFKRIKIISAVILTAVISFELTWNSAMVLKSLDAEFGYVTADSYSDFNESLSGAVNHIKNGDGSFYRIEKTFERSKNDAIAVNMNGISHYSSAYDRNVNRFLRSLGFAQDYFWCSYFGSTPITDSMFGIKYILSYKQNDSLYEKSSFNADMITVYKNPYALPIGGVLANPVINGYTATTDPFYNQNQMFGAVTGNVEVFKRLKPRITTNLSYSSENGYYDFRSDSSGYIDFTFTAQSDNPIYVYLPIYGNKRRCGLEVNGVYLTELFTSDTDCIQSIGRFNRGEQVQVRVVLYENELSVSDFLFYEFDTNIFAQSISKISNNKFETVSFSNKNIKGKITVNGERDQLLTSIRADDGWRVYVDGHLQKYTKFEDTLICVPLPQGEHTVEFRFTPKGLMPGTVISVFTMIVLIVYSVIEKYRKRGLIL